MYFTPDGRHAIVVTVTTYATAGSAKFTAMTTALAISAGLVAVLAGLMRLGFLANFISERGFALFLGCSR